MQMYSYFSGSHLTSDLENELTQIQALLYDYFHDGTLQLLTKDSVQTYHQGARNMADPRRLRITLSEIMIECGQGRGKTNAGSCSKSYIYSELVRP